MYNHYKLKYRYFLILSLFHFFLFTACQKEQATEINIDVSYTTADSNFSIPARVKFLNNTTGATKYEWAFEGGEPAASTKKDPGVVIFNTKGVHKVTLIASDRDNKKVKDWMITVDSAPKVDFDTAILINHYAPITVHLTNKTIGCNSFNWTFEGGMPANSTLQNPTDVTFTAVGDHKITLTANTTIGKFTSTKTVTVLPALQADFNMVPSFEDEDYETPLTATLENKTISGVGYTWSCIGATISNVNAQSPTIYFPTEGSYNVTLEARNGKETKTIIKTIDVKLNTNLRTHKDIKLGINPARSTIGSFYSTKLRRIFRQGDNMDTAGKWIDIVYFGLNKNFTYNKFVSPDSANKYNFSAIPLANATKFINSQELCGCGLSFTATDFDNMVNDMPLRSLTINPTTGGWKQFSNTVIPRIVLFQTKDGRKGAIKIKQFVPDENNSYIIADIKIQKE